MEGSSHLSYPPITPMEGSPQGRDPPIGEGSPQWRDPAQPSAAQRCPALASPAQPWAALPSGTSGTGTTVTVLPTIGDPSIEGIVSMDGSSIGTRNGRIVHWDAPSIGTIEGIPPLGDPLTRGIR